MSSRTIAMDDRLYDYFAKTSLRETPLLARLRRETMKMPERGMQISPEQGQFMALLVELIGARKAIEVGTFTGYSSISIASALPAGGKLVCCDLSDSYTGIARRYWARANVGRKIELRLGPATVTLDGLIKEGGTAAYDFVFIDADKSSYDGYYERALKLLRRGGLVAVDNMLWGGAVADPRKRDKDTRAIRALNRKARNDRRVAASLVPIGDGLLLARKR
ncbi:MAG: O-methyltransferase [Kiloniellales bacterium]